MPGVAPAGEVKEFGVSPSSDEPLLFRQKWPKPLTPRLALLEGRDANLRRAAQLAGLRQGPLNAKSAPPLGQPAGGGSTGRLIISTSARLADMKVRGRTRTGCCKTRAKWFGHRSFAGAQDDNAKILRMTEGWAGYYLSGMNGACRFLPC
jgi:hypothetical protein